MLVEEDLKQRQVELETFDQIRVHLIKLLKEYTIESRGLHPDYVGKVNTASSALLNLMKCSDLSMQLRMEIERLEPSTLKTA